MSVTFVGTSFSETEPYGLAEKNCQTNVLNQIEKAFPNSKNLLISTTWFGPQFTQHNCFWDEVLEFKNKNIQFDNVFFLSTVDPPMIFDNEIRQVKNSVDAMCVYLLGNFDSTYQFNFFAPVLADKFVKYSDAELMPNSFKHLFINYNRKPRTHRVEFVNKLRNTGLDQKGIVTLGQKEPGWAEGVEYQCLTLNENQSDWVHLGNHPDHWGFGIPLDNFSLHRMDIWASSFLYINGATEFDPNNDLFCQQDTFKPIIGLRPFVINGVQKTYRWLRHHGFKTFNHYWPHIDIENGDVHHTIIELINFLNNQTQQDLLLMYSDMLPLLHYNKERFFEFAAEQKNKINNLFVYI
jgi:hypothetical protein